MLRFLFFALLGLCTLHSSNASTAYPLIGLHGVSVGEKLFNDAVTGSTTFMASPKQLAMIYDQILTDLEALDSSNEKIEDDDLKESVRERLTKIRDNIAPLLEQHASDLKAEIDSNHYKLTRSQIAGIIAGSILGSLVLTAGVLLFTTPATAGTERTWQRKPTLENLKLNWHRAFSSAQVAPAA